MPIPHPAVLDAAYARSPLAPLCRLRFYVPGTTIAPVIVTPTDGQLTHDAGSWPRTTLDATLPTTITPTLLPDALTAFGGRVTVTLGGRFRGVDYTYTAATLAVASVRIDRPDAAVGILATSLEAVVNEDRYDTPTDTAAGRVSAVVHGIVTRSLPGTVLVNQLGALDVTLPAGAYELDGDLWPTIERMMDDAGGEAFFSETGALVLRPVPVVATTPNLVLAAGEGGALTGYESVREWGPNRVALVYTTPEYEGRTRHVWTNGTTSTPADGRIGANTADPANATVLYVARKDEGGTDVADTFAGMRSGDTVRVIDPEDTWAESARWVYRVTSAATIGASVISIPVTRVRVVRPSGYPATEPATPRDVYVGIKARRRVGTWQDTAPSSPTRVGGPYGRHTYREDLPVERGELPTQTAADAAALAMARRVVGRFRQVTARGIPAPWIIPGDTVRLGMLGGLTESHVVQRITLPLPGLDVMTVATRDSAYVGGPF